MPVYEYECAKCKKKFEKLCKSFASANDPAECPKCGNKKAQRVMSVCSVNGTASEGGSSGHGGGCACCPGRKYKK